MLLPTSVDDYVPPESPIRVIDAFVDVLDLPDLPGCEFLAIDSSFFKAVNRKSRSITKLLKPLEENIGDLIYIADCKLITKDNLRQLQDLLFISRFPATFKEHDR
ncbi:MAG: hypothetical protein ACJAVK_001751, partial [Akkermansiaceae bacterium]